VGSPGTCDATEADGRRGEVGSGAAGTRPTPTAAGPSAGRRGSKHSEKLASPEPVFCRCQVGVTEEVPMTTPNEFEQAIEDAIEDGWLAYEEDED
jgi:hypothetical protein